ncbi:MAG: putative ABC-class ATPase [Myxococcota bacterium]|jgi:predicted ABC-class ATPase
MPDRIRLERLLQRIDGRQYPAYRDLGGAWELGDTTLFVDHVQGDPFAAPSRVRLRIPTGLEGWAQLADPDVRLACEDWLLRRFAAGLRSTRRGSGKSGVISVYRPGPEVVARSAVQLEASGVLEVRFAVGLPARGRRVLGCEAEALLLDDVARAADRLRDETLGEAGADLREHMRSVREQRALRRQLRANGLVAFVADGSVLPRRSGIDQRPLPDAVPMHSPTTLRVQLDGLDGPVHGLGIRRGITLIVGGGFHGKSTLLQALQRGHLDHVPGDGRERVVSDPDTVKVRAEDGRRVTGVDISAFLSDLPGGRSTRPFSTDDASGSTSQAAAIVEAAEAGARVLLLDEDTCATNLLVHDARMRALIPREREPITPLVERIRALAEVWELSTVLVVGGVGDFLAVADVVIAMDAFRARDVTDAARALAGPVPEAPSPLPALGSRVLLQRGLDAERIRARDDRAVQFGDTEIDLTAVDQVLDGAHAYTLGCALRFLHDTIVDGRRSVGTALDALDAILADEGVAALSPRGWPDGGLVCPRRHEVAAALNRLRSLEVG